MSVHLFGIRHHGVGSARSLLQALADLQPDCILIEGPPEANELIPLVVNAETEPPVAILVYNPDAPQRAAWYPMAIYSPEWQAMIYAMQNNVAVQFMDLPQKHMLALEHELPPAGDLPISEEQDTDAPPDNLYEFEAFDPLQMLAEVAGETDGESWWNRVVEESRSSAEIFHAIHESMTTLREQPRPAPEWFERREALREAWMRKTIRAAEKTYERVAVVCGAWHTPALENRKNAKADNDLVKGLANVKTVATIAPWTYSRIGRDGGYGAGVVSPGWYHHLWETTPDDVPARWLGRVAALLRGEGLLASTAQVIDAVRLSEMLALIRGRSTGLGELNEASVAVLCAGQTEPLALIRRKLIIGERIGSVPPDAPAVPLQRDLTAQQKRLRLKLSPDGMTLDLDLRQPNDLARSQLFHRLNLLQIHWATTGENTVNAKGTFHEYWDVRWMPELDISTIEASIWGSTVKSATAAYARHQAGEAQQLSAVTRLLTAVLLAALPDPLDDLLRRLSDIASLTHDMHDLMAAAPPLVDTLRYGDVRGTDVSMVAPVLENVVLRVCIGLYRACINIDHDAAALLNAKIIALESALNIAQNAELLKRWHGSLNTLANSDAAHP
ncbi:MAG: hypothetical protein H7175_07895, partial [Burkholderiales bacterium]|nr:hypothetical protein [Anaerolineae bacterium]